MKQKIGQCDPFFIFICITGMRLQVCALYNGIGEEHERTWFAALENVGQ